MVVKELIEKLKAFDEDKEIKIVDGRLVRGISSIYESDDSEIMLRIWGVTEVLGAEAWLEDLEKNNYLSIKYKKEQPK